MEYSEDMPLLKKGYLFQMLHDEEGVSYTEMAETYGIKYGTLTYYTSEYRAALKRGIHVGDKWMSEKTRRKALVDIEDFDPEDMLEADTEELLTIVRLNNKHNEQIDPVITHHELNFDTDGPIAILLGGCMQIGGRWTFHDWIADQFDDMLSQPGAYIGLFGDETENFMPRSFAGARSINDQSLTPPLQRKLLGHWFEKIGDRLLWGTSSQHGTMWNEKLGFNPVKELYLDLGVPFFDGQFYLKLHVGEQTYQLAGAHQFPGNSMHNKNHSQQRALKQRFPSADIVVQADKHQYSYQMSDAYGNEVLAGNRASRWVHLIQIGTAKGGPDPYTIRGWERGVTEWPWLVLWPDEHRIAVTPRFDDVRMWLS